MHASTPKIAQNFSAAAETYDRQAAVQADAAMQLIANAHAAAPQSILDVGCGTGFVAAAASQKWPAAHITAIDHAPAMLQQAQRKMPRLTIMPGDAADMVMEPRFDMIFSSMMLHWLPQPLDALKRWQGWLKPRGQLHVALLTQGSFQEWRELCAAAHAPDGLWPMPRADFADELQPQTTRQSVTVAYPSAQDFLQQLKNIGAATPRDGHHPLRIDAMRRLLAIAPRPFNVTYQLLFIALKML